MPTRRFDAVQCIGMPIRTNYRYDTHSFDDPMVDIASRWAVLEHAIHEAHDHPATDRSATTLKVFVAPEFFFRGKDGTYPMDPVILTDPIDGTTTQTTPIDFLVDRLTALSGDRSRFSDWLFFFGTAVFSFTEDIGEHLRKLQTKLENDIAAVPDEQERARLQAQLTEKLDSPTPYFTTTDAIAAVKRIVLNIAPIVRGDRTDGRLEHQVTKEFQSGIDFLVNHPDTVHHTQERDVPVTIPTLALVDGQIVDSRLVLHPTREGDGTGDLQTEWRVPTAWDPATDTIEYADDGRAAFKIPNGSAADIAIGVDICLDHGQRRLTRSTAAGHLDLQIIPACGMNIVPAAVATKPNGIVFNVNGNSLRPLRNGGHQLTVAGPRGEPMGVASSMLLPACHRDHFRHAVVDGDILAQTRPMVAQTLTGHPHITQHFFGSPAALHIYRSQPLPAP